MTKLKLRVGAVYSSRDGSTIAKIVRLASPSDAFYRKTHPFVDDDGYAYMPDGRVDAKREFGFDLTQEIKKDKPALRVHRTAPTSPKRKGDR